MSPLHWRAVIGASLALAVLPVMAGGREEPASRALQAAAEPPTVDRLIVRLRDPDAAGRAARLQRLGGALGERLTTLRAMSGQADVARLGRRVPLAEARAIARRLAQDPDVLYAEPDVLLQAHRVPNDVMYGQQWDLYEAAAGVNAPAAWDVTTGAAGLSVAIVDSGVRPHAELAGRLLPGWDFVTDPTTANDGGGRDNDASDPGDYGCNGSASSWHGTHVAGTVGAAANNGSGVAGLNWASPLLPVRVLGRCGGYSSDIIDGLRWAAGIAVAGAPANPYAARVINLSAGGPGACSYAFQSAVNDIVARGAVLVVSAGNDNADVANTQPANCNGVVAVAAVNRRGGRASYSNYGAKVTIAAPGGGDGSGILSTLNSGSTTPGADSYANYQGTSMAAPHVTGAVSLLLSVQPTLSPAEVLQRLQASARRFPSGTGSDCGSGQCGAGLLDAGALLAAAVTAPAPATTWTLLVREGQSFSANGTVRYGTGNNWVTRSVNGSAQCTNEWFGNDPAYGYTKQCELASGSSGSPAASWTRIANEYGSFDLGTTPQTVRYGIDGAWTQLTVAGAGQCSNAFFGNDPAYGWAKVCEAMPLATAANWTTVAQEWQGFNVNGTRSVRYGIDGRWVVRNVTGNAACTNDWFGTDPAPGIVKRCEVLG